MEGGRSVEEEEEEEEEGVGDGEREDSDGLAWKEFFGSSVSLAPSLLSIFDRQVAATTSSSSRSQSGSPPRSCCPLSSTERTTADDDNCGRGAIDQTRLYSSPFADKRDASNGCAVVLAPDPSHRNPENGLVVKDGSNAGRLLPGIGGRNEMDPDLKKRPLSLRSTSSNSSSSLSLQPHQRKKVARDASTEKSLAPTLSVYSDSSGALLPTTGEKLRSGSRHEVVGKGLGNGLRRDCGRDVRSGLRLEETTCRSDGSPTRQSLNRVDFSDRKSEECLSIAENYQDYSCMEVDEDLDWSPTPPTSGGRDVADKRLSRFCEVESTSYTDRVVREIVETERAYVRDLQDIIQGYVEYVHKTPGLLSKADANTLFGNIQDVYRFHSEFLRKLEKSGTDPVGIAECFVQSSNGFTIYSDYCTNYPRSVGVLTRCSQDRRIAEVMRRQQMSLQHGLPLGSYLLKPVQRILKYHLLLQNLLNNYDQSRQGSETISRALGSMMSVAQRINDMKRAHERSVRIQEIQSLLYDWNGLDPNSYGDLVLEDQFQMFGAKAFRLVWVLRKAVVIAKRKEDDVVQVKTAIMFSNLMLVETIQRAPLNFHLIPFDNPKTQYTVQARTVDQKRHWCQEIKRLILENYEAVIPEKAKQLVMIMGKDEQDLAQSTDGERVSVQPAKNSANLERRKGRQRSAGFISDLGILKSKRGSKALSPGTATPDSDAAWKSGGTPDVFGRGLDLKGVVSESFCQDLDHKSRTLHTSFSLQNIQNPPLVAPLRKLGGSEGDWRSDSNERHLLHTKKLLTAESLEEEFSDSNSRLSSSQSVKSADWPRHSRSKEAIAKPQTPAISEEPPRDDYGHQSLRMTNSSPCDSDVGSLSKTNTDGKGSRSSKNGFSEFNENKFHAAVSLDAELFTRDHAPPNATRLKQPLINDLRAGNFPPFLDDRSCSSDSLVRNSGVQNSYGNVFVDRTAFVVSESSGCMGNNRGLDRRLARLCTPPREFGSPAFVRDVRQSKERGKTVCHYGTPMRMVEFPDDICGGNASDVSGCERDASQDLSREGHRKMNNGKLPEYPIVSGSLEIFQMHPRRSTSVQEDMVHSCVQVMAENSTKLKPKRSGSFHGNSFYSTRLVNSDATKLPTAEVKSPVSSIKSTLLSWTEKLTKRRSHSTENQTGLESGTSTGNDEAVGGDKTKNKSSMLVSRLARASYRKLKREKSIDIIDSRENESPEVQTESLVTCPKVLRPEEELCQQLMAQRTRILSTYALKSLPRQRYNENTIHIGIGHQAVLQNGDQQGTNVIETLGGEPFVRQPQNCCSTKWTPDEAETRKLPCNDGIYHLRYIDDDRTSIISERLEETNANEQADPTKVVMPNPVKAKACSAVSLPGMRNGFAWSNSLYAISQADGWTQASVSNDGRLNCFGAPHGHWIPYIDDSGDDD